MTLPKKLSVTFSARRQDPLLLHEVGDVFHSWIARGELNDLLVDVADYQHVPRGPGVLLIGHECNYQVKKDDLAQIQLVCWQKRPLANKCCPLTEVFTRALRACALLEQETKWSGLFDPMQVRIGSRDRLETEHPALCLEEFSWHVRQTLSKALLTVRTVKAQEGDTPKVIAQWVSERSIREMDEQLSHHPRRGEVA